MNDDAGMSFGFDFDTSDGPKEGEPARPAGEVRMGGQSATAFKPLPFRVLAVANFCGAGASRSPKRVTIDRDELDKAFGQLGVSLFLTVEDVLGGDSKGLEIRYEPRSLKDLEPAGILKAVPAFDLPGKLLTELKAVEDGSMSPSQFRSGLGVYSSVPALAETLRLAEHALGAAASSDTPTPAPEAKAKEAAPAPKSSGDDVMDSIFSMVDTGEPAPPPPSTAKGKGSTGIGAVISAIGGGKKKAANVQAAIDALSAVLSKQVDAVLHDPGFREVEAAWRGLKLLVERGPKRGVVVEALDTGRDTLQEVFHEHVWKPEYEGKGESALSLAVVDFAFGNTSADLAVLEALATDAEQIQAPVVASLTPDFSGVALAKLAGMGNPKAQFETGFAEWNGKRKSDSSRWLCAAFNRVLLRIPFKPGRRAGPLTETVSGPEDLPWGNAGWVVAANAARSMGTLGWPTGVTGARDGTLPDLPVWTHEDEAVGPMQVCLSDDCVADLAATGITGVTQRKHTDSALVLRAPVVHRITGDEPKVRGTLAYQLLAARLGETVLTYKQQVAGGDHASVVDRFKAFLEALLGDTGPGARVMVQGMPDPEDSSRLLIGMTAFTGRAILGGVQVDLGIRV